MADEKGGEKLIASNRKARHEYFIEDTLEAGIALTGTEIQSVRLGRVSLGDAFAEIRGGEAFLVNSHISEYDFGNRMNHDPRRKRKLLLHKAEIRKLDSKVRERGYTIVPLRMYMTRGYAKVEIGLARGKKLWDKREDLAKRDAQREMERAAKPRAGSDLRPDGQCGIGRVAQAGWFIEQLRRSCYNPCIVRGGVTVSTGSVARDAASRDPTSSLNGGSTISADNNYAYAA